MMTRRLVGPDYQAQQTGDERNEARGCQPHERTLNGTHVCFSSMRLRTADHWRLSTQWPTAPSRKGGPQPPRGSEGLPLLAGHEMSMWRHEGEQFGSRFNLRDKR